METTNNNNNEFVKKVAEQKYEFGFTTDVHTDIIDTGLNEDVVRLISQKKGEPEWMLDFRLKAYNYWKTQEQPTWGHVNVPDIDYQAISYYADPMAKKKDEGKKEIDPELMKTFDKLGIPLEERLILSGQTAVDAIMDSVSVKTTYKEKLAEKGIIFCSIGEAIKEHSDLVREYLGTVVPYRDNFFAALNSAVFSDGSFVYIPKGVRSPMELSSYFRINARNTGQFERTLITPNSRFDKYLKGDKAALTQEEITGYELFKQYNCATCHVGENLGGQSYELMGLQGDYFADRNTEITLEDHGRNKETKTERDIHRFKVPGLRNIALTAPYFHDGTKKTLEEAVRDMAKYEVGVELTDQETAQLVSFLKTLTGEYKGKILTNDNMK